MTPVVGVTCSKEPSDRLMLKTDYLDALRDVGVLPVIFPYITTEKEAALLLERVDGILFSGGNDLDPAEYGENRLDVCGEVTPERDLTEKLLVKALERFPLPTFGICRGIQSLNVFNGGTLWQDIPSQIKDPLEHRNSTHEITPVPGTLFAEIVGETPFTVNSFHHQSVKNIAPDYAAAAFSPDGTVEALVRPGDPSFLAVQFHPERSYKNDARTAALFKWFATVCGKEE